MGSPVLFLVLGEKPPGLFLCRLHAPSCSGQAKIAVDALVDGTGPQAGWLRDPVRTSVNTLVDEDGPGPSG